MQIRLAKVSDAERVAEISGVLGYSKIEKCAVAWRLDEILRMERAAMWVCVSSEAGEADVVGWIHAEKVIRIASKPFVEIVGLAVAPHFQRQGVGARLVRQVLDWANADGMGVRVRTNENRTNTMSFYRKCGFVTLKNQQVFCWDVSGNGEEF